MGMEFRFWSSFRLLVVTVTGTPSEAEVEASRAEGAKLTELKKLDAMILDLRQQVGSHLTAQKARAILVQCDRHLSAIGGSPDVLPIAIITQPGSIGQGIGRMFLGHAYGMEHLKLDQFDTEEAATDWLGLPPDWRDMAEGIRVRAS